MTEFQRRIKGEETWVPVSEADVRAAIGKYYGNVRMTIRDMIDGDIIYTQVAEYRAVKPPEAGKDGAR